MPSVDVNGCPINYIVEGTGNPVLLIHGFASSLQGNWRAPAASKKPISPVIRWAASCRLRCS